MKEHNRYDILTDINIAFIKSENNWVNYYRLINEKGKSLDEDYGDIDRNSLLEYMQHDCGVITRDGEICKLNKKGLQIYENGGWLKHLKAEAKLETEIIETEIKRQEKKDKILDLEIKLKEFEAEQGAKMKKWSFRILVINLIITITVISLSQLINKKSETPTFDQSTKTEKTTKQKENQTLIKKDKDSLESE